MSTRLRHKAPGLVALLCALALTGCTGGILMSRQQLQGADPAWDLVAGPILSRLKTHLSSRFSVRGVRLLDPLSRAVALWGKPSRTLPDRAIWTNAKGIMLLRVRLDQIASRGPRVVRQIDVFSGYRSEIHPRNRALFRADNIESPTWRKNVFGSFGKALQRSLDTRYLYMKRGFRLVVLSKLLPLQRKVQAVFSLFVTRKSLQRRHSKR